MEGVLALVYDDEGTSSCSAYALVSQLKKLLDSRVNICKVGSAYLREKQWENKTVLLVMGGGVCSSWEKNLGEEGIFKIHHYVTAGGKYLGLCAGAYFASSESHFQPPNREPLVKKRPLSFFEGRAVGPLSEIEEYLSPEAAFAAPVSFSLEGDLRQGKLYYQGGCYFEKHSSASVMGTYEGLPIAVLCPVGEGLAFLLGPHPEFEWSENLKENRLCGDLARELIPEEPFREEVWIEIGKRLGLPCRV